MSDDKKYCIECGLSWPLAHGSAAPCSTGSRLHGKFVSYEKYLDNLESKLNKNHGPVIKADTGYQTFTAGPCTRCGNLPHPYAESTCPKSETGKHEYRTEPKYAHTHAYSHTLPGALPHTHTHVQSSIAVGDQVHIVKVGERTGTTVSGGLDGTRCTMHRDNQHPTCRACRYAQSKGGVKHEWLKANPGTHTQSINYEVPADWDGKLSADPVKNQVGGQHYQLMGITPFQYSLANHHNCLEFSIVKYLRKKGGKEQRLEDLRKLIDCAEKLIDAVEKGECE